MKPTHIPVIFIITIIISRTALFANSNRLSEALEKAEDNSVELQKVLDHYQDDSLKYQAAAFLIFNWNTTDCFHNRICSMNKEQVPCFAYRMLNQVPQSSVRVVKAVQNHAQHNNIKSSTDIG